MTEQEQAAMFIAVHKWAPIEHAEFLAANNKDKVPFCTECADWHFENEEHSQA